MATDRDPDRDAWLREALRHAPDADAAPSAEISDSILRQARNAVKTPQPAPRANPLMQWWSWLARPPVAAGFATVMVATLVGVMWWDKPLDETLPSGPAPTISEAPVAAAASAALPPPVQAAPAAAVPEPAPAPAAKPAAPARSAKLAQSRAPEPQAEQRAARTEASAARDAAVNAERERVQNEARQRKAEVAPVAPAAAPVAPPAPAPTPVAESAGRAAPRGFATSAPAPIVQALRAQDAELRTPTIDDPARWAWQRAGVSRAMSPELQRWLAQLDATARWQVTTSSPPSADNSTLKLWRSNTLQATILLRDSSVWLLLPGKDALTAPLTADESTALRAALIEATP